MAKIGNLIVNILRDSSDHKGMPLEVEVEYLGVKSTIKDAAIKDALELYLLSDDNKMTPEQLIDTVRNLDELARKAGLEGSGSRTTEEEKKEEKEPKIKIKYVAKKIVKWVLIGATAFVLLYFIDDIVDWVKGIKGKTTDDDIARNNTPAIEQGAEEMGLTDPTATPEPVVTAAPVPEVTPQVIYVTPEPKPEVTPQVIYVTPEPKEVEETVAPSDLAVINRGSTDWVAMSDEQYFNALTQQTIDCQRNMNDICAFLEGEELGGEKHLTNIQSTFRKGSNDYLISEYFNQLRNEVVNAAYDTRNRDNVNVMLDRHLRDMYLFCTNQKKISLNGFDYYFSDMSHEGRNAALDVLIALTVAMPHDRAISINGVEMYPYNISQFYEAQLGALILVNPTNRK